MTTSTPDVPVDCTPEVDFDELRAAEYARLDSAGHVYLDYTGGCLYAARQLREHQALLADGVFGNPHSSNPTSRAATEGVERARAAVLRFFNADPAEYAVIFTANASGALKLVGESYPFRPGGAFLLTFDNHNSVNGIREFARSKGATVTYTPVRPPDLRIDAEALRANLAAVSGGGPRLFAYPGQSNFSGVQHDVSWIDEAHAAGWAVLLDAAAFAPTNVVDMGVIKPDFMTLSFYKMFGYPTGIGALLARRDTLKRLQRPWFAGGTITVASVQGDRYYLHEGAEGFEDGTLDYLNLPAVEIGLRYLSEVGVARLHERLAGLTARLIDGLQSLKHANGKPLVRIYGPTTTEARGATVTFNVFNSAGHFVDHRDVESAANAAMISLRTGCFCNPGDGELALGISAEELSSCFVASRARMTIDDFRRCIDDKSTGAVRVSLGIASNAADVDRLIEFLGTLLDRRANGATTDKG